MSKRTQDRRKKNQIEFQHSRLTSNESVPNALALALTLALTLTRRHRHGTAMDRNFGMGVSLSMANHIMRRANNRNQEENVESQKAV